MRPLGLALLGTVVVALSAGACWKEEIDLQKRQQTETPIASGTPVVLDSGDGSDGDLLVSSDPVVVNTCHGINSASGTTILLNNTAASAVFPQGRRVVLFQTQDSLSSTLGDQSPVTSPFLAGQWEIARVSANDSPIALTAPLANSYSSNSGQSATVCTLREFANVHVAAGGALRAASFGGPPGAGIHPAGGGPGPGPGGQKGFLAVLIQALVLDSGGLVSVSGSGSGGGPLASSLVAASHVEDLELPLADGRGGGKGYGIDGSYSDAARGNAANGGGGGNADAAGGGGGGAGGGGGNGSPEAFGVAGGVDPNTCGLGGAPLITASTGALLFMGGGGGAAQTSTGNEGGGGRGGGIMLISLGTLFGHGSFHSNGGDGNSSTVSGGGGGGGAGGTILILASNASAFAGSVQASGGNGGSTATEDGPGGGGGGGWILQRGLPAGIAFDVSGGSPGLETAVSNNPRGAANGTAGVVVLLP